MRPPDWPDDVPYPYEEDDEPDDSAWIEQFTDPEFEPVESIHTTASRELKAAQWLADPLRFGKLLWPDVNFYNKQRETIYSVEDTFETYVPAAHKMGKDFVAGFIALRYFLVHSPVRVVTTSVKDDHLRVLWGEINRFIDTAKFPLDSKRGGPLVVQHREIKKIVNGKKEAISYMIGSVSERGEGMAGHHAPHALFVVDEASGVDDEVMKRARSWAKRILIIGNPYPCTTFFYHDVKGGDLKAPPIAPSKPGSPPVEAGNGSTDADSNRTNGEL